MRELDSPETQMQQEQAIHKLLLSRLACTHIVQEAQRDTVAYRLAEIFVAARQLYTTVLPSLVDLPDAPTAELPADKLEDRIFEAFGEVRMNLLHMRDLMEGFENTFMESLTARMEAEQEKEEAEEQDDEA